MMDKLKLISVIKTPEIEFLCAEEDWGVIPPPVPARKVIPKWFKALPGKLKDGLESSTIKRCNPFLDALSVGWIIPLAADVEFTTNEDASGVSYKWSFYKPMIENHGKSQITTNKEPHPDEHKPPMKFLNHWIIRVPKGYSLLFVPPLNRPDPRFTCLSGLVDADGYYEFINFPFQFHEKNFQGIIEAGTPLVQVIPIKRDTLDLKMKTGKMEKKDHDELDLTRRKRMSHESHYRNKVWTKKP